MPSARSFVMLVARGCAYTSNPRTNKGWISASACASVSDWRTYSLSLANTRPFPESAGMKSMRSRPGMRILVPGGVFLGAVGLRGGVVLHETQRRVPLAPVAGVHGAGHVLA